MNSSGMLKRQLSVSRQFAVTFTSYLVGLYGVYIIADTLLEQLFSHRLEHLSSLLIDLPLLIGLSVIYLSSLLKRRKRTAWLVTILAYTLYLVIGVSQLLSHIALGRLWWVEIIRTIIMPVIIISVLYLLRKDYVVKSDIQGFQFASRFIVLILLITVVYGVAGFELMDNTDFHQEIGWGTALHYTVDQFNITTNKPAHPYTRRAKVFVDSLSFVSFIAISYAAFALFQPLRSRFSDQSVSRERVNDLFLRYGAESEEFFKLWPHDKQYFFDDSGESVLAFHVHRGVALCIGDPIGNQARFTALMAGFLNLCFNNDWLPSLIHVSNTNVKLYERSGFAIQKLGQEAVVNLNHFETDLKDNKYFRQILNRFNKQAYSYELLTPPHHRAVIDRLRTISDEWLSNGNRSERGFVMGYFTDEYMQMCKIAVARDAAGTIQAFTNLVPANFNNEDATYDLLRQSKNALSNVNDFLIMKLIEELNNSGYKTLNMGLSPLAGLDESDNEERKSILDNVLKFAYANGDMFFSFSGLYRFKSKYEPEWQDRYVGFKGGIRGFSKTMTSLTRCMGKVVKLK